MQSNADLNDLSLVAAIHDAGSLARAAERLRIDPTTAFRRLKALERQLGVRLFERDKGRYAPTLAGEELARAGATIADTAQAALLAVAGEDLRPSGLVRVTTTDSLACGVLPALLRECRQMYPQIRLEVVTANAMFNLSRRDADIALRPTRSPPETLIGKKIGALAFAVYGADSYLSRQPSPDLSRHDWIAMDSGQSQQSLLNWLAAVQPIEQVALKMNSYIEVCAACMAGLGLAVLPCYTGDGVPGLRRLQLLPENYASELWLLAHPDLYRSARVRAVFEFLHTALKREAARIGAAD